MLMFDKSTQRHRGTHTHINYVILYNVMSTMECGIYLYCAYTYTLFGDSDIPVQYTYC
jgi:hypothetical protein